LHTFILFHFKIHIFPTSGTSEPWAFSVVGISVGLLLQDLVALSFFRNNGFGEMSGSDFGWFSSDHGQWFQWFQVEKI
jgi:hypothetical protein